MKLTSALRCYIDFKQALGYRFRSDTVILKAFGRAARRVELRRVGPRQVKAYLDGTGPLTTFWHRKWVSLHGFYNFALARGWIKRSPLPSALPQPEKPFVPYIFSREELQGLFKNPHATPSRSVDNPSLCMLLQLLYGAGLRLSEALRLRWADVDWKTGVLTIGDTKFFKTRWVPLAPPLLEQLDYYVRHHRHLGAGASASVPVLANRLGNAFTRQQAERAFRRQCRQVHIQRTDGARYQPRLHDLRHSFAVHRLIQWYRQGADVQRLLPDLSTYLGHRNLSATQRYLTMTPELLKVAGEQFEQYARPTLRRP